MKATPKKILGIWDGHDAGAAMVEGDEVVCAVNEERFTRKKLDVGFPEYSVQEIINSFGTPDEVAISTADFSKVLSRIFPFLAQDYYLLRRHKVLPRRFDFIRRKFKSYVTQMPILPGCKSITKFLTKKRLNFGNIPVKIVDHHLAHAQSAFYTSPFDKATVITLDGVGDTLSGLIGIGDSDGFKILSRISGRNSIALLYEEATRLLNMRELEDEGKVMALAAYADLRDDEDNELLDVVKIVNINGVNVEVRRDAYYKLRECLWKRGPERFAAMVQRMTEVAVLELVRQSVKLTGINSIAVAGGLFSNVRVNRLLRERIFSERLADVWIFPNMGDGGLALGCALLRKVKLQPFLGIEINTDTAANLAKSKGLKVREVGLQETAKRISSGETIGWINGRMEYGPRALGARSILARPDDRRIRDKLNLSQKKRVFFQPFCPTMTKKEALKSLQNYDGKEERWMTSLYGTTVEGSKRFEGVIGPDGSCRPQILDSSEEIPEEKIFFELINEVEKMIGIGAVLNTSFNIHGDPIVRTEEDAINAFILSGLDALIAGGKIEITK